jgi:hypothetical protein
MEGDQCEKLEESGENSKDPGVKKLFVKLPPTYPQMNADEKKEWTSKLGQYIIRRAKN